MLASLHIENLAVIKKTELDFHEGFTVLTGETGAGKSILIDGIGLLCGSRADKNMIRTGADSALVSGYFVGLSSACRTVLAENGLGPEEDEAMFSRSLSSDGRSVCRINGRQVPLSVYKEAVGSLINIHGQQDNWSLTQEAAQADMLDRYAKDEKEKEAYRLSFARYKEAEQALADLKRDTARADEEREMLSFRANDLAGAKLKEGEEEKLLAERILLQNAERIEKQTSFVHRALTGGEKVNAVYVVDRSASALRGLSDVSPEYAVLAERLETIKYELEDISETAVRISGAPSGNPTELLTALESRLDRIERLKKKYRADVPQLLRLLEETKDRLSLLENAEGETEEREKALSAAYRELETAAAALTEARLEAALALSAGIGSQLDFLDMPNVRFLVSVSPKRTEDGKTLYTQNGADEISFLLAGGEEEVPKPLSKIASGGELSRIMLAAKSVFCEADAVATIIYDEVDAGVSGRTARKIGIKLKETAQNAQVFCVTHSAQIASLAQTHVKVLKLLKDGQYESHVRELDRLERIDELARILGGISITDAQRRAAKDLISEETGLE
ncbi:MAG: DNA repair protein RecN [Clostridia bacterium]|nr:DNA repair protein RecN [Clostridia bacterium]